MADQSKGSERLAALLMPVRRQLRRASGLSVAAALLWPVQAALAAQGIAGLLQGEALWWTPAAFALVGILRAVLSWWAEGQAFDAALATVTEARARIVTHEARTQEGQSAGLVAALAGEKLEALVPWITRYAPARARVMVLPFVLLALAFSQSWAVGLVLLVTGPLIPVFMALVGMAAEEASRRQMAEVGSLNDLLVERLSALVDIRLLGAGAQVAQGFLDAADRLRAQTMAVLRVAFLSSAVLELFSAIGVAMVAVYVGFDLLGLLNFGSYGVALSPAAGIFLLLIAPDFFQPLRDLSAAWHDKAAALAVARDLHVWEVNQGQPLLGRGAPAARLPGPARVEMRGVTARGLRYPDLTIAPGERVALMGASGAGKTTLLRLLAGLLAPDDGVIHVAGQPLTLETADAWRARLGWMPQAPQFQAGSLAMNLGAADPSAALRLAAVADVVAGLPQGLSTRLGETGGGLSGGEARRLTLARALNAGPDMILADEPTADLDATTADQVTEGLLASGCTLIVATHDPLLAARMDRVIQISQP